MAFDIIKLHIKLFVSKPGLDDNDTEPEEAEMNVAMTCVLRFQISSVYTHNPRAAFLLIVNCRSPSSGIKSTMRFIHEDLKMCLDIFNISLGGSFKDPLTQRHVVENYVGKSVIIMGGEFPCHGGGKFICAIDLLDISTVRRAANNGTSFFFDGATMSTFPFEDWIHTMRSPVEAYDADPNAPFNQ